MMTNVNRLSFLIPAIFALLFTVNCSQKKVNKRQGASGAQISNDASKTQDPSDENEELVTSQDEGSGGFDNSIQPVEAPAPLPNKPKAVVTIDTAEVTSETMDILDTKDAAKPPHQILDADALEYVYGRVFTAPAKFTNPQRKVLGTVDFYENPNSAKPAAVTNSYLKIVRGYAATECRKLVKADIAALTAKSQAPSKDSDGTILNPDWKLVPRLSPPSTGEVSAIMGRFFGHIPNEGDHRGAEEYAALIQKHLKASTNLGVDIEENYTLLCIVAATDFRTMIR